MLYVYYFFRNYKPDDNLGASKEQMYTRVNNEAENIFMLIQDLLFG